MPRGGSRENAGRKKGEASIARERMNIRIAETVEANLDDIITPLLESARAGDVSAARELLNRGIGLPRQNIGLDGGEDDKPILIDGIQYIVPTLKKENETDASSAE